jgi:hypothetical protein
MGRDIGAGDSAIHRRRAGLHETGAAPHGRVGLFRGELPCRFTVAESKPRYTHEND